MYLSSTYRGVGPRLRLTLSPTLGAGNFLWHAWRVAGDRDRPVLFHAARGACEVDGGLSLDGIRDAATRYAGWYHDRGVRAGHHVGVQTADGIRGLLHHVAITGLGAVAVHANPCLAPDVAAEYFTRTDTSMIVTDPELAAGLTADGAAHVHGTDVVDAEAVTGAVTDLGPGPWHRHRPDEVIMLSHSSGTTGRPKAAAFAHRAFFAGRRERLWTFPSVRGERMLTALPHSHSAGISHLSLALMLGVPVLVVDDTTGPSMDAALRAFRPTVVVAFPITLAELSTRDVARFDSVHTWMGMGDASHEAHIRPLVAHGARYVDGLGSSEMGMVLFRQIHSADSAHYGRRVGGPIRTVRHAAVLAEDGTEVPAGGAGLLGVRAGSLTPGYWDDPDLTARSTLSGYFLTGDVVRRDRAGTWYHLDRTPDVITTAAGQVHSLPLEEVVLNETGALDATVVAVDAPGGGSAPFAVVLRPTTDEEPAALLARCNDALDGAGLTTLADLMVAADRSELPVGPTGKVLKRTLRETYRRRLTDATRAAS